jgi:hypothetical protein
MATGVLSMATGVLSMATGVLSMATGVLSMAPVLQNIEQVGLTYNVCVPVSVQYLYRKPCENITSF